MSNMYAASPLSQDCWQWLMAMHELCLDLSRYNAGFLGPTMYEHVFFGVTAAPCSKPGRPNFGTQAFGMTCL